MAALGSLTCPPPPPLLHPRLCWPVGSAVPFVLTGWRGLPFPARTGMRCVIGEPIPPPALAPGDSPTQQQVDALHAAFYAQVRRLWEKHREGFPGYEDVQLVLTDRHLD